MPFSKAVAKQAFFGNDIICSSDLIISGAKLSEEQADAIYSVDKNYDEFCTFIMSELRRWPLTERYFHKLVEGRLRQNAILASGFIARLLGDTNALEERFTRIQGEVENLESITAHVGISKDINTGQDTDETLLDLWNEIFVIDLLLHGQELGFAGLEKVVREQSQPQVDLIAKYNGHNYAVEITRIHKKDFKGSTMPEMYEAVFEPANFAILRSALKRKLRRKNKQMMDFCANEMLAFDKRLVVIKTSQWEYQDASKVIRDEVVKLMKKRNYPFIDEVLLIYDIENYDWLK